MGKDQGEALGTKPIREQPCKGEIRLTPVPYIALSELATGAANSQGFALGYRIMPLQGCKPPTAETGGVSARKRVDFMGAGAYNPAVA